jgi:hypothetical protein
MTRKTKVRLAALMFFLYIATGMAAMALIHPIEDAVGMTAKLASIAEFAPRVRLAVLLSLLTFFEAVVLAAALYAVIGDDQSFHVQRKEKKNAQLRRV